LRIVPLAKPAATPRKLKSMTDRSSPPQTSSALEVLFAFLRLGCLSFGGPVAHLGYFHTELVERRKWCDEETYAEVVAIAQSMPGPASSQVGFALGLLRAGWKGGVAAWLGFTMPSALLMLGFAFGHHLLNGKLGAGAVHGLQLVAVAVVAQAILAMRKSLAPDAPRMAVALGAALVVFFAPPALSTVLAIIAGAALGWLLPHPKQPLHRLDFEVAKGLPKLAGVVAASLFLALLLLLPLTSTLASSNGASRRDTSLNNTSPNNASPNNAVQGLAVFSAFYRTGALVFGGGHVVLPLLENAVVSRGWVDQQSFLSGYGAAQALPGPLFTFAAYLGAAVRPTFSPFALSGLALTGIFLPGLLVMVAVLPFWNSLRARQQIQISLRGVNAAVVGVLIAAFVRPVWSSAVHSWFDVVVAVSAFVLLIRWKVAPWIIVVVVLSVSIMASAL
jgi:chromate transporter